MNWTIVRFRTYLAGFIASIVASALAFYGLADFDTTTGMFDPRPFNIYELAAAITAVVPGLVSSGLAALAVWRKWGVK